jgi:hypothetical protein
MALQTMCRVHVNGYALIHVHGAQWTVCSASNRLGVFPTREEASAFAFALPPVRSKQTSREVRE